MILTMEQMAELVNQVPSGFGIYGIRDGMPYELFLNDGYYKLLGVTREERPEFRGEQVVNSVHPDDRAALAQAIREAYGKDGALRIALRIMRREEEDYCWLQLDGKWLERTPDGGTILVSFSDIDGLMRAGHELEQSQATLVTLQAEARHAYQNHLDSIMQMNPEAFATVRMNLTRDVCGDVSSRFQNVLNLGKTGTASGFFADAQKLIYPANRRKEYGEIFRVEAMVETFYDGGRRICHQHRFELQDGHSEWIETVVDLVENPQTGDIEGILYANNINTKKIENMILAETLQKDYMQVVVFFSEQNEYYLFDEAQDEHCGCHQDFWENGIRDALDIADSSEWERLAGELSEESVRAALEKEKQYTVTFQKTEPELRRYQIQFTRMDGEELVVLGTLRDITDESLLDKLKYDSEHDALTGLYNREMTFRECDRMLEEHPDEVFAVARFDIQRFRLYNSFYGEAEGDRLLLYIAGMIREFSTMLPCSVFGRIEADVFLLAYPYSEDMVLRNEQYIHDYLKAYRDDFYITGSCGMYLTSQGRLPAEAMFNRAGIAVKNNHNRQTSRVAYYDDQENQELLREQRIIKEMRPALQEHQFVVYLQPKYRVADEMPYGAEALVRWIHPEHGLVPPDAFIPIFEKNGFIMELDQYMWEEVCRLLHTWKQKGLNPAPVSVNVSRVSMYSPQMVAFLDQLTKRYEIDPKLLNLELTETAYMDAPDLMKARVLELQQLGFQMMMDDFGSAYSSLNTLRELPVDFLKMDRKFLASIEKDPRSRIVLSSVVHMASALSIPVVMEGVESTEQRNFVAEIGCEYIQGYYFSKPMSAEEYEDKILNVKS